MKSARTFLATTALALASAAVSADVVSYSFTGNVTWDDADRGYQGFAGSFSFDSAAVNLINDPSGSTGAYTGAGAPWALSLAFDGGAVLDFSSSFFVNIGNNLGGQDSWGLLGSGSGGTVSATLYDLTAALFGNAGLPLHDGGYTLADFGWSDFKWESDAGTLQGMFASLSCTAGGGETPPGGGTGTPPNTVPEPGSLTLAMTSLALLLRRRYG